ncbi:MAG TPA: purine-nucleoside phosphorylase [Pseudogracilibacillus sp.]|nr:purine-nucleoside phosphorylase [Pseudogracilibacillus sp.]
MSIHIGAKKGDIAETILLPGDPLRAKYIAENYLEDVIQYNDVRGMLGFTGTYKGKRISVQGTGMGVPSISIYVNELIQEYDVQTLVRVGTCGGMQEDIHVRDIVLGQAATTDSQMNRLVFGGVDYAPIADFNLLQKAYQLAEERELTTHVGNIFTSDAFYRDNAEAFNDLLIKHNVLAVEMEAAALYTLAAKFNRQALTILTVSDHIITGEQTTSEERQTSFNDMMTLALDTVTSLVEE